LANSDLVNDVENKKDRNLVDVSVRTILNDDPSWERYSKEEKDKRKIKNDKRYIRIRKNNEYEEYISTQALHESLIIFRIIEKLYKDNILESIDLADWWRELLPFATGNRLEFYVSYFSEEDIRAIVFVIFNTVLACHKYRVYGAIKYFKEYYNSNADIHKYFQGNERYRLREKIRIGKFNRIVADDSFLYRGM